MPQKADNQIKLGGSVYLFKSPDPAATDCIIIAHGSSYSGTTFKVPVNCLVQFAVDPGQPYRASDGPINSFLSEQAPVFSTERYTGGNHCPDQLLQKALGKHWRETKHPCSEQYYQALQEAVDAGYKANNWAPHLISIRNRKLHPHSAIVWLSEVVRLVQEYDPAINRFYSFACRTRLTNEEVVKKAGKRAFTE